MEPGDIRREVWGPSGAEVLIDFFSILWSILVILVILLIVLPYRFVRSRRRRTKRREEARHVWREGY